eukprot:6194406-Pleurochrysis_carterae.AAC.1
MAVIRERRANVHRRSENALRCTHTVVAKRRATDARRKVSLRRAASRPRARMQPRGCRRGAPKGGRRLVLCTLCLPSMEALETEQRSVMISPA